MEFYIIVNLYIDVNNAWYKYIFNVLIMKNLLFIICFIVFNASTCVMDSDEPLNVDSVLTVINKTDKDILFVSSFDGDTLINRFSFLKDDFQMNSVTIYKKSQKEFKANWIYSLTYNGESGILHGFIFDKQTVIEQPWDSIVANNMVLKRYDLSLEDLNSMNWTITYP